MLDDFEMPKSRIFWGRVIELLLERQKWGAILLLLERHPNYLDTKLAAVALDVSCSHMSMKSLFISLTQKSEPPTEEFDVIVPLMKHGADLLTMHDDHFEILHILIMGSLFVRGK